MSMALHRNAPTTAGVKRGKRYRRSDMRAAAFFLLPATVGFVTFYLWPTIRGFYLSFTEYALFTPPQWIGLDNYTKLVHDPLFWNSLKVTLYYVVLNIGAQTVIALGLAVLLHRLTKSALIRGVVLMPWLVANVIVAITWQWTLDYQVGIVNQVFGWIGVHPIAFFGSSTWAIPTIAFVNVWRHVGYTSLLIFAGLQTVPSSVYEAGALDGASEGKMFWRITMPLLRPVMVMVMVLTVIGSFQIFDTVAVTTKGGPINSTRVIYYYIYQQAFTNFNFGYGSAISVVLFVILAGVAIAQMRLLRAGDSDLS